MSEVNAGGRQSKDSWLDQGVEILEMGCGCGDCFSQPVCVRERKIKIRKRSTSAA